MDALPIHLLGIPGSLRTGSYNRALLAAAGVRFHRVLRHGSARVARSERGEEVRC